MRAAGYDGLAPTTLGPVQEFVPHAPGVFFAAVCSRTRNLRGLGRSESIRRCRKSYAKPLQLGDVMTGESVAQVLSSNHPAYAEGDIVLALTGWRPHALSDLM